MNLPERSVCSTIRSGAPGVTRSNNATVPSVARYEFRVGDNHHHLVCLGCGLIFDINCAVGSTPCLTADDDHGFEIDEAEVIYWGRCPDCRA
jgi:Fe2+ or Zn2+ uptake regulation protein